MKKKIKNLDFEIIDKIPDLWNSEKRLEDYISDMVNNIIYLKDSIDFFDFEKTLEIVNIMLIIDPYNIDFLQVKWNALEWLWKSEEALEIYLSVFELWSNKICLLYTITSLCLDLWKYNKWLEVCVKWIEKYPNNLDLLELKTKFDFKIKNYSNSLEWIDEYLQKWLNSHSLLLTKSKTLYELHLYDEALEIINLALDIFNSIWEFWYLKWLILSENENNEYIKYYDKALDCQKLDITSYINIWNTLLEDKIYYLSLQAFKKVVELDPTDYKAHSNISFIYGKYKNEKKASIAFNKSKKLKYNE